jgi:hypothetical protein
LRLSLFGVGAALGLAGMWLDDSRLINGAVVVLLAGIAVRFKRVEGRSVADVALDVDDPEMDESPDDV